MLDDICPREIGDGEGTDNMTAILVRFNWFISNSAWKANNTFSNATELYNKNWYKVYQQFILLYKWELI